MQEYNALLDETTYIETLESGLKVAIHPKPNYKKILVTLQVNFGGVDMHYQVGERTVSIPEGVAHFLEHSLFQNNGRNMAEEFAKHGAKINAFTTKSVTAYTYECHSDFNYLLDYFLSSFIEPGFSLESIEKEKKIIKHELVMSDDSIHTEIFQKLKNMMYTDKAIRCDVGGKVSEVMKIDREILIDVFNTFYHPKNMSLIITGDVLASDVFKLVRNHLYNTYNWPKFLPVKRIKDDGFRKVHNYIKKTNLIDDNIINIGIKIPNEVFETYPLEDIHIGVGSILGNIFGLGSKHYDNLEKKKLMNISFSAKHSIERDYGFLNIYMQTKYPKKYMKEILDILLSVSNEPLDEELFEIDKKAILGNYIRLFDSLSRTHEYIANCLSEEVDINNYLNKILALKIEDIKPITEIFVKENIYTIQYLKVKKA